MRVIHEKIRLKTSGDGDLHDLTGRLSDCLSRHGLSSGVMTVFVVGSTASVITMEYEPGLREDVGDLMGALAPGLKRYHHDDAWGDANGFSHLRATLLGPSLSVPFDEGRLMLGTWQQVVLAEFDNRQRDRTVVVTMAVV